MNHSSTQDNSNPQKRYIWVDGDEVHFFALEQLTYMRSHGNYTSLHFDDKRSILSNQPMKDLIKILPHPHYFRIHHSYLINLYYITEMHMEEELTIELLTGDRIPLSSRKKSAFLKLFKRI